MKTTDPFSGYFPIAPVFESSSNASGIGAFDESIDSDLDSRLNALAASSNVSVSACTGFSSSQSAALQTNDEAETACQLTPENFLDLFLSDETLTQFSPRRLGDDSETILHYSRCVFQPGQTRFVLHIPFYPTLAVVPIVATRVIEFDARTRVTDRQRFGTRIEIISNQNDTEPTVVVVETTITTEPIEQ